MDTRFVIDTVAFINFFNAFFGEEDMLSSEARKTIGKCFDESLNHYKLIVPSIVLVEIFKKFLRNDEFTRKFYYEVYSKIKDAVDIEIKEIEKEVLELFYVIGGDQDLELHDKLVFASAAQLECPLITNDPKIISANKKTNLVPNILF